MMDDGDGADESDEEGAIGILSRAFTGLGPGHLHDRGSGGAVKSLFRIEYGGRLVKNV